jgi:hypothetical protein
VVESRSVRIVRGLENDGLDPVQAGSSERLCPRQVGHDQDDPRTDAWIVEKGLQVGSGARSEHRDPRIHWRVKLRVGKFPCQMRTAIRTAGADRIIRDTRARAAPRV